MHPQTILTLAGQRTDRSFGSVAPPIYQTATFQFEDVGQTSGFDYTRSGNPTRRAFENALAALEEGAGAVALTSGMAAVSTVLALVEANAHVICSHDCYGGTERLFSHLQEQGKIEVSYVDLTEVDNLEAAIREETRLVWAETPSNPLLRIVDLEAVGKRLKDTDALFVVDNTFLSPCFQKPLAFGADLVVYSTTKYINGHSDVVGGAVVADTEALDEQIQFEANAHGTAQPPFDCWLVLRGLKTLPQRMKQHEENAQRIAHFLESHSAVQEVFYPGLASHRGHEVADRQQEGFGGMVSFRVRGGEEAAYEVLRNTHVFALAESLGGVESLIQHPATMSHASMQPARRREAGITGDLIRLSVGIEHIDDLTSDLTGALKPVVQAIPA